MAVAEGEGEAEAEGEAKAAAEVGPAVLRPAVNLYFCAFSPSLVVKVTEAPAEGEIKLRFQLFLS